MNLVCQSCGNSDITFNKDVMVAPGKEGNLPPPVLVKAGDPFYGKSEGGPIWYLSFPQQKAPEVSIPPPATSADPAKIVRRAKKKDE
jgi:hypothetical protein